MYIYSTLSNNQLYRLKNGQEILVAGRANVANKNLITPRGVVTSIEDDVLNELKSTPVFAAHLRNGFLQIASAKVDPEEVAKDMKGPDKSAQATKETLSTKKSSAKVKE